MLKKGAFLLFIIILSIFSLSSLAASPSTPPKNIISMEQAQVTAAKAQPGTITGKELEYENDQWIYSFDIRANDNRIHEVHVSAVSGKVVSHVTETPARESAEAAAEKKTQKKKTQ